MKTAAVPIEPVTLELRAPDEAVDRELPALDESVLAAEEIVHLCGLGSFPASDPPSWWT